MRRVPPSTARPRASAGSPRACWNRVRMERGSRAVMYGIRNSSRLTGAAACAARVRPCVAGGPLVRGSAPAATRRIRCPSGVPAGLRPAACSDACPRKQPHCSRHGYSATIIIVRGSRIAVDPGVRPEPPWESMAAGGRHSYETVLRHAHRASDHLCHAASRIEGTILAQRPLERSAGASRIPGGIRGPGRIRACNQGEH